MSKCTDSAADVPTVFFDSINIESSLLFSISLSEFRIAVSFSKALKSAKGISYIIDIL
jgi:hypothetical protein